jgi:hypothetical protein
MSYSKIIIILITFISASVAQAQTETDHQHPKKKNEKESAEIKPFDQVNDSVKSQIGNLLSGYYKIKDALVSDDDKVASSAAKAFRKILESVDMNKMTAEQHAFYMQLHEKLDYDAGHIQGSPTIEHMREHFESFSDNMWKLIKAFNASNGTAAYRDYCSMQKKYWISDKEEITNPYYGKQMLTCGKVTDSIR